MIKTFILFSFAFQHQNPSLFGLNIGCKTGETTKKLSTQYPELKWYGIDTDQKKISIAQKRFHQNDYLAIDIEKDNFNIKNDSFQIIEVSEYKDLMINMERALLRLSKGGILIYNCKDHDDVYKLRNQMMQEKRNYYIIGKKILIFK